VREERRTLSAHRRKERGGGVGDRRESKKIGKYNKKKKDRVRLGQEKTATEDSWGGISDGLKHRDLNRVV